MSTGTSDVTELALPAAKYRIVVAIGAAIDTCERVSGSCWPAGSKSGGSRRDGVGRIDVNPDR